MDWVIDRYGELCVGFVVLKLMSVVVIVLRMKVKTTLLVKNSWSEKRFPPRSNL